MADFSALKTSIQNYIKQNGNEEITGNLLQQILLSIVSTLGDSAINDLVTALNAEIANRGNADTELGGRINTLQGVVNGIVANVENGYVYAGIATPSTTPTSGKVFYLALTAGTYTNFGATVVPQGINILKYNGSAWSLDSFIGLDDAPTQGSGNLVKSGGVLDSIIKDGSAFDLSAYNNGATYADLSAALTALNALPAVYKKGGMSIKFVQSSDNNYHQFILIANAFTTDIKMWQEVYNGMGSYSMATESAAWFNLDFLRGKKVLIKIKGSSIAKILYINDTTKRIIKDWWYDLDFTDSTKTYRFYNEINNDDILYFVTDEVERNRILNECRTLNLNVYSSYTEAAVGEIYLNSSYNEVWVKVYDNNAQMLFPNKSQYYVSDMVDIKDTDLVRTNGNLYNWDGNKYVECSNHYDNAPTLKSDKIARSGGIFSSHCGIVSLKYTGPNEAIFTNINFLPQSCKRVLIKFTGSEHNALPLYKGNTSLYSIRNSYWYDLEVSGSDIYRIYTSQNENLVLHFITSEEIIESIVNQDKTYRLNQYDSYTEASINEIYYNNATGTIYMRNASNSALEVFPNKAASFGQILSVKSSDLIFLNNSGTLNYWNGNKYTPLQEAFRKNVITVKKDGSGDFTTIQAALNSITDASKQNRYEVRVYDDFVSSSFADLHYKNNPSVNISGVSDIDQFVCLVTTKDWVDIVGIGGRRKIMFENPDTDMAGNLFQYVHCVYVQGNVRLENLDIRIKGGRYAIHQDLTGLSTNNPDINATTEYINCHIEHFGNSDYTNGAYWATSAALAACPSSGGTIKVKRCFVTSVTDPLICHLNKDYKNKATYILEETSVTCKNPNISLDSIGYYMGDMGTNQRNELIIKGCNIPNLCGSGKVDNANDSTSDPTDNKNGGIFVSGYGNEKAYIQVHQRLGISFKTASLNSQISVVGGSAKSLIFGDDQTIFRGDADNYGYAVGNLGYNINGLSLNGVNCYKRSLPYLLGNCATNNKNLVVNVDGTEYNIVFNKNYMTSDGSAYTPSTQPAISGNEIVEEINNAFSEHFTMLVNEHDKYRLHPELLKLYSFADCIENVVNTSNVAWKPWQCVKRDYSLGAKGWRLATTGEIPDGIVGERIDAPYNGKYNEGVVILTNKAIFGYTDTTHYMIGANNIGTKLAVNQNAYLSVSQDTDAPFTIVTNNGTFVLTK